MTRENTHILDASPRLFDDIADILDASDFSWVHTSNASTTKGVRRRDTAGYDVSFDGASVHIAMERRLGNPKLCVAVIPSRGLFWRHDESSEQLAQQLVAILINNGAEVPA
jgi:hypothetical protein